MSVTHSNKPTCSYASNNMRQPTSQTLPYKLKFHRTDTDTDLSVRDAPIV